MIKLLLALLIGLVAAESRASNYGVDLGAGFFSNYGFYGGGIRYFRADNHDLHATIGTDITGLRTGLGSRLYTAPQDDKCFFFFACEPRYFGGATLLRTGGGSTTVTSGGVTGSYEQSDGYAGHVTAGSFDKFSSGLTFGIEVGYLFWLRRPSVTHTSGPFVQSQKNDLEDWSRNGLTAAVTLGWMF